VVVTPHASFGVIEQFTMGGTATGSFVTGDAFDIAQIDGQRTMGDWERAWTSPCATVSRST
jgi:hypothetical protein